MIVVSGKYNVIYADPPWSYNNKKTGGSMHSGASQKYSVLSLKEISDIINEFSDTDALLYMWCVVPMLPEALEVLKLAGFKYKTMLTWHKQRYGLGFWYRVETEHLIVAVKGKIKPLRTNLVNFYSSKPAGHSVKPDYFSALIEESTKSIPNRKMVELFARKERNGWDCFGNQISHNVFDQIAEE